MGLPYVLHPAFLACASRRNHSNNVVSLHVTYFRRLLTRSLCSMYRDPDEATLEDNVVKVEQAAALRRSTIRREHSVRPRRYIPPTGRARRELADIIGEVQRPHRSPFVDANDEIQHLEAELEQFRHRILTTARPGARESRNPASMTRVNPQDVILRSAAAAEIVDQLPRESALRFELGPRAPARSGATSPRRHRISRDSWTNHRTLPSPPHSIESTGRVRAPRGAHPIIPDGPIYAEDGYTADFAPARGPHSGTPQPSEGMNRVILERNLDAAAGQPLGPGTSAETPPPESWEASYPPLRRVGRLSPRPRSYHDHLGLHRRSMSPGSPTSPGESIVNEDHWETLLTTINDDALHHQSSFNSTRSNSELDSHQSTQTAATSFGEIGSVDDTCDLDLPQGITEDDVREIRERNRSGNQTHSGVSLEQQLREAIHETPGGEMGLFQNLLSRLAQRDDIPTGWWSAAGLARTVRENV
jgi:hypothetical protein